MQRRPPRVTSRRKTPHRIPPDLFPWTATPGVPSRIPDTLIAAAAPLRPQIYRGDRATCYACGREITRGDTFYLANPAACNHWPWCFECGSSINMHTHGIPGHGDRVVSPCMAATLPDAPPLATF
ncbi:MAG TPA: hypothetical protein VM389_07305 [Phycisphaerae bacterium]|nr:hypothetical protein [Phycisphaerae bacterium]